MKTSWDINLLGNFDRRLLTFIPLIAFNKLKDKST
jgi:hypothetical protein